MGRPVASCSIPKSKLNCIENNHKRYAVWSEIYMIWDFKLFRLFFCQNHWKIQTPLTTRTPLYPPALQINDWLKLPFRNVRTLKCSKFVLPMCSIHSAVSGEALSVVDDYEGKSAREIKDRLAIRLGFSRFRQRLWSADWSHEIQDDEVFTSEQTTVQLVVLEHLPQDSEANQMMISMAGVNNSIELEELLHR